MLRDLEQAWMESFSTAQRAGADDATLQEPAQTRPYGRQPISNLLRPLSHPLNHHDNRHPHRQHRRSSSI